MKKTILLLLLFCGASIIHSQKTQYIVSAADMFSRKKVSYISLKDGGEIEGKIKKLKRTKGLFKEIQIETEEGEKHKLYPEDIESMYLPQSGFDKLNKTFDFAANIHNTDEDDLNYEYLQNGYAYFESVNVEYKGGERTLLLQLLNPSCSQYISIYHNPYARETQSIGIGGFKVAGGKDRSYYVKKGKDPAFKLKRTYYNDEANYLYGDCDGFVEEGFDFFNLGLDVHDYTYNCKHEK